jgi:hypothetical protein
MASQCVATVEVLLALQTHFHAGCVYLMQSHNTSGDIIFIINIIMNTDSNKLERIQRKFAALCHNRLFQDIGYHYSFITCIVLQV